MSQTQQETKPASTTTTEAAPNEDLGRMLAQVAETTPAATTKETFALLQRRAQMLAASDIIPDQFKNKLSNCAIAIEMADRIGANVLTVMQSLYIVHGKPGWSSTFVISAINSCGRFSPLRYEITGQGDKLTCVAWTTDKHGERFEGPPVSIGMAKSEGWYDKKGSKWPTMPDLMLRYRAATLFGRLYCPEVLMGLKTQEEIIDSDVQTSIPPPTPGRMSFKSKASVAQPEAAPAEQQS